MYNNGNIITEIIDGEDKMVYIDKFEKAEKKAENHGIATKILDLMNKLRLNENDKNKRRWIWELLQNAKDVSFENNKVSVNINLDINKKILEFSHNGKPFTSENIIFLLKQVSTKDRSKNTENKTIGKFGTGFLTTHLLSEIVLITGVLKEPDEPYKQLEIKIDRSGREIDTIIKSVEDSLNQLNDIDYLPNLEDFNPNYLNTKFTYDLNEKGIEVARQGIEDLLNNIIFTLTFLPDIESINIKHLNVNFELKREVICLNENISLHKIIESKDNEIIEHKIITITKYNVSLALQIEEIQNKIFVKKFKDTIPKLFCQFPLVGSDKFPFPFIINSPDFNPTEPRHGVHLIENEEEENLENIAIMIKAKELYFDLLDYASKNSWGNMHLFAAGINSIMNEEWFSNNWMEKSIIKPLKNKLLSSSIIDTYTGNRISIIDEEGEFNAWFPSHRDPKIRSKIWELCSYWIPERLPLQKDIDNWYSVLWDKNKNLTLSKITENLQNNKNIEDLESNLKNIEVFNWFNLYFALLNAEGNFIEELIGDKYAVIPNQNGTFKKRTELNIDKQIDEELKNVLNILDEDFREKLLHQKIFTGEKIKYNVKSQSDVINKINELILIDNNLIACLYTIALFPIINENFPNIREDVYNFSKDIFKEKLPEKKKIENWSLDIWKNIDEIVMKNLVKEISAYKNVDNLSEILNTNRENTLEWLNKFISFLNNNNYDFLVSNNDNPILPNQNGVFLTKDDLFADDCSTQEILKDISKDLGLDIRKDLLCVEIYLKLPESRTINQKNIAEDITQLIKEKNRELSVNDEIKQVYRKLLIWFNENNDLAKELFQELYKNKHKLYDDNEIAENMEKAVKYDEIMDKFNIQDISSLEKILETNFSKIVGNQTDKQSLTNEILIQLGIFSQSELDAAFNDKVFSDNFMHISEQNPIKFDFVEQIIDRSITNVFKHLRTMSEYDVSAREEIAKTIFSVTKNDEDIYLIIRPSDYDKIIIYYDSEKDLLDYEKDCELWVDDGKSPPQKITFGKILKITGLNKIPLKKII